MSATTPSSTSPPTAFIASPETPEDEPTIHPTLQRYISALTDSHTNYTRFFSALLIPKDSHPQFFLDLKQFREQPTIIYLLHLGTSKDYREASRNFVGSRFAHPWCRVQSDFSEAWRRASWIGSTGAKEREKVKKEEEKLHRLLVPIWIVMRRRMFPGDEVVRQWSKEQEKIAVERAKMNEVEERSRSDAEGLSSEVATTSYPDLGFAIKSQNLSSQSAPSQPPDPSAAEAASRMFLGAALTSFIMSDKRVKKYVQKKMLKK